MRPVVPLIAKTFTSPKSIHRREMFGGAIYVCREGESVHGGGMLHSPSSRLRRWCESGADPHAVYQVMIQAASPTFFIG
jgi:hypothetical protein